MDESIDLQKIKLQLSLLNAAVHALCAVAEPGPAAAAHDMFQRSVELTKASLLGTGVSDEANEFFDEVRASLAAALRRSAERRT